ncbi:ABC transporter ATP-binding protein [Dyella japonica A8]|uniref:ABC transporter ATP-binding protein n=1 Tax=Dyella japonica A8 TaxID=1217721 RepID=A0A075K275_9GAMM|nr:ABC transporter ATP-binding protein [Dyella japonica A8]
MPALRGVDLEVHKGELLMLVGPSGCGKTSLISILAALLDPDTGECQILGENMQQMKRQDRAVFRGRHIGFVFQAFNLLPALSALDNVAVPLLIQGTPRQQTEARARQLLERVGLADRAHLPPLKLSGGQQQRIAIARALVHGPDIILCDEPTSSLDHATGHAVIQLLRELAREEERALIIVTHDTRILSFADRIAHMDDGRIVDMSKASPEGFHES